MPSRQSQGNKGKINILLVDDREENLISLSAVLDNPGYNLVKAASGKQALKALLEQEFALILLDVQMPVMDGFETAALIKQRERTRDVPIIFVTAISKDEPFVYKGYHSGAVDYITKPFDPEILRSKVAVFAQLHRQSMRIREQADQLREAERMERERKIVDLELRSLRRDQAAQQRYRELIESIPRGIVWSADPQSLIVSFVSSKAEPILGYTVEQWGSERDFLSKIIHPDDLPQVLEHLKGLTPERSEATFEHRFVRTNGSAIWFQTGVRLSKKSLAEGVEIEELRGLSVDITHLKEAEEEAANAIRARDEFLSIASHELKTPMTPLKLQLQSMRRYLKEGFNQKDSAQKWAKFFETSERQLDRLTRLVNELLDVARIQNGKLYLEPEQVDLTELVRDVVHRYSQQLAEAGCEVKLDLTRGVAGNWDRMRMEQVFTNLLGNAVKYAPGKPISIRLATDGTQARLEVKDGGMGISEADQKRIFERFERAVSNGSFGGLGLGLYIVSKILKAHEGKIWVESKPGKGSNFIVEIPLQPAAFSALSRGGSPAGASRDQSAFG